MTKRLLHYYERELRYIRELGAEFGRAFPKVAGRLGLRDELCDDPHVERLFQGHSFLAARIQQRLDAEFPRLSEALLEKVYPHHLAATPSMVIVQLQPDAQQGSLDRGYEVAAGSILRTRSRMRGGAICEYRTAHAVRLWPITLESAHYTGVLREIDDVQVPTREPTRALVRLRLRTAGGRTFSQLKLNSLPIHLNGADETTGRLYEAIVAHSSAVIGRWTSGGKNQMVRASSRQAVQPMGFADEHALLPVSPTLRGHRLLQEYFAMPSRYHFVELQGIEEAVARCDASTLDIYILLRRYDQSLEGALDPQQCLLYATPAINLFPRTCDLLRPDCSGESTPIIPDRARPTEFEVHSVRRVTATVAGSTHERELHPIWSMRGRLEGESELGHYELERRPRLVPTEEQQRNPHAAQYAGSEMFLRLQLNQGMQGLARNEHVRVDALCTNRDLPLLLEHGNGIDFTMPSAGPVRAIHCISGPTPPRGYGHDGETSWSLINHLSHNYLALCDGQTGGQVLRELLALYAQLGSPQLQREVGGIQSVEGAPVIGPIPGTGLNEFVRGLEITMTCDERAFAAHRPFLLAAVLSEFFARHASVHSFTKTVLQTPERGEVYRWPAVAGQQSTL
ncbi:MAG TPA: type VI secretion system baseplate subunit TssF [Polyangiales bacterium]|nr:type VI secretion system baseplate subunit TssF [Polyangiales bacterium]